MEDKFDLQNIAEVEETNSSSKANQLLKKGWVLLAVIQDARFYHEGDDYSRPLYVLGRRNNENLDG